MHISGLHPWRHDVLEAGDRQLGAAIEGTVESRWQADAKTGGEVWT
jgi:hypothetical protein